MLDFILSINDCLVKRMIGISRIVCHNVIINIWFQYDLSFLSYQNNILVNPYILSNNQKHICIQNKSERRWESMQSIRNKQKCQENCQEHIFDFKNLEGNHKYDTELSFCPKFRRDPHPPQKTIPEFNFDKEYYTSAFVLGTDKKSLQANVHQQLLHFNSQVRQAKQKNNQVFFPKPNQKNSYCSVCKTHYLSYYEHIQGQLHIERIDAAIYNTQIKKLCENFRDIWQGAHEKADRKMREQYQRLQQQLQNQKDSSEQSEQSIIQDQSESDNYDLEEDMIHSQNDQLREKRKSQVDAMLDLNKIKQFCDKKNDQEYPPSQGTKDKKKKKVEEQFTIEQYKKSSILKSQPRREIPTRSALSKNQRADERVLQRKIDDISESRAEKNPKKHKQKTEKQSSELLRPQSNQHPLINKNPLVVLLRKNTLGRYEIIQQERESKSEKMPSKSLQLKIKKDTKQIIRDKKSMNENNNLSGDDNEDDNLCDTLKNQWRKKKIMDMKDVHGNLRNSAERSNSQRGNFPDDNNARHYPHSIPYPYYYGYRMPSQNRMQPYQPYPPPPPPMPMAPQQKKQGRNPQSENPPNKQTGYYPPYQFPYHNSWFPQYMMHPQMMKQRAQMDSNNAKKSPPGNMNPQNMPKSPMYPPYPPYGYQGGNQHYMPYMMNQPSPNSYNKSNQPPNTPTTPNQSQQQFWYPHPQMMYNMSMNPNKQNNHPNSNPYPNPNQNNNEGYRSPNSNPNHHIAPNNPNLSTHPTPPPQPPLHQPPYMGYPYPNRNSPPNQTSKQEDQNK